MKAAIPRRRADVVVLVVAVACAVIGPTPVAAAQTPQVLREASVRSPKAPGAAMLAVTRAGKRMVAVGERGIVLLSDDDGRQWRQAEVPVQVSLTTVRFVDARTGWVAGHLGVILKTEDGGESWSLQLDGVRAAALQAQALAAASDASARQAAARWLEEGPDKPFFDLEFVDARRGYAVGAFNMAFATVDGGKTWTSISTRLSNPKNLHLYAVRLHDGRLYVAGEQGLLLQSTDQGASFEALPSPYKGSFFGLLIARSGSVLAYGLRGSVFRSVDQGRQWQKVDTGLAVSVSGGVELADGQLVLLTQEGQLLASRDDGASFVRQPATPPVPSPGLAVASDGSLVLTSLRGTRRQPAP